jgi:hypothetical protein
MKIRALSLTALAFLISLASSDARSGRATADDGGPLSRDRGLAEGESAAVGTVLRGVTGTQADVAATPPSRRYSPDYYRAYPQRLAPSGPSKKAAVAPAPTKPAVVEAPRVAAQKIPPPMPSRALPAPRVGPKTAPLRVAVMPRGKDRSGTFPAKVTTKPTPPPAPAVARAPKKTPLRVAVMPRGIDRSGAPLVKAAKPPAPAPDRKRVPLRVAVLPRGEATPQVAAAKPRPAARQPAGLEPVRVLFR